MRIAFALAVGACAGLAGWAIAPSDVGGAKARDAVVEVPQASASEGTDVEARTRPDLLAAPPWGARRAVAEVAAGPASEPTPLPPALGGPPFDARLLEGCVAASDDVARGASLCGVRADATYDVEIASPGEVSASHAPRTERRGYDTSRCWEYGFDDGDRCPWDVEVAQDAYIPDPGPARFLAILVGTPSTLRRLERLPAWAAPTVVGFEGTSDDLDAYERALDAETFAGGRDVTLDVVRLADPSASLSDVGLAPPAPGTSVAIPLRTAEAIVRRARGASSVTLDVPEDRAVSGCVGAGCVYVGDYDIEISQAASIAGPICRVAEAGLGVSARVSGGSDDGIEVTFDARWTSALPSFETFSTSLASGPVTSSPPVVIEIPKAIEPVSEFHGRVRTGDDEGALVGLGNGEVLVIVPRSAVRDTTHVRTWKSVDLDERSAARPACPPESETIEVEWTRIDDAPTAATRGSARFEHVGESGVVGSPTKPGADDDSLCSLGVPGSVYIVPGPVLDRRRIDVVVRPSRPLEPGSRPFSVLGRPTPVDLPRVSRVVIPLRFLLRDGETGVRDLTIDRGEGPETWRVSVSRRAERYGVR